MFNEKTNKLCPEELGGEHIAPRQGDPGNASQ
jgi:hypothetical protein